MKEMMDNGGLSATDENVDPVSGNEIPVGSTAKEVRDDVPVNLSEGEYVVPADVVKYIGLSTFEKMVDKAKEGLQKMDEEGRIGGATPEDRESILEHTLGSDVEALDGYAQGGLVEGTDYMGIIDRVKDAAMKDPSITNMLKSKGIHLDANPGMAEGGLVDDLDPSNFQSGFNPYAHTPGFSGQGAPMGQPAPYAGGVAPVQQPVTCPEGFIYDAATNACVPDPNAKTYSPSRTSRHHDAGGPADQSPTSWMDKFDYTNPETLTEQTLTTLGGGDTEEDQSLFGQLAEGVTNTLAGGVIGKFLGSQKYAQAMANASVLESYGHTDQANAIREAAGVFADERNITTGGFFDQTERLTQDAMRMHGRSTMGESTDPLSATSSTTRRSSGGGGYSRSSSPTTSAPETSPRPRERSESRSMAIRRSQEEADKLEANKARAQDVADKAKATGKSIAEVGRTMASSQRRDRNIGSGAGGTATREDSTSARDAFDPRNMNKGGLVKRPKNRKTSSSK